MTTRSEVDAINAEYVRAMAEHDVAGMISLYAEDASLFFSDTPVLQGSAAVAAFYEDEFKDGPVAITFESTNILDGDGLVVDIGHYAMPSERGKYVVVFRRQRDGTLKSRSRRTSPTDLDRPADPAASASAPG
jgi:ketosteroid isomerase-like protein